MITKWIHNKANASSTNCEPVGFLPHSIHQGCQGMFRCNFLFLGINNGLPTAGTMFKRFFSNKLKAEKLLEARG